MGSSLVVGVVVVGVTAVVVVVLLVARYMGVWAWVVSWMRAGQEEKVQLCGPERHHQPTRSYLLENDLDWLGLWPRTGSYKRFTNLDDANNPQNAMNADDPTLPPQPLRPAPQRPSYRLPGRRSSGDGSPSPDIPYSKPQHYLDYRRGVTRDICDEILPRSTNPFNPAWQPMPGVDDGRYINPFHDHQTSAFMGGGKVPYESKYSPNYDPKYDRSHVPIDPFSRSSESALVPYSSANHNMGLEAGQIPYRPSAYLSQQVLDQRSRFEQHRLSYQERYEPHKYDSTSRYEPSSKFDRGKYQTELYNGRSKYEAEKYDSLKPHEALGSAYSLYDPRIDHNDPRRRRGEMNGIYDQHISNLNGINEFNHQMDQRSPMHSPSTTVNNMRMYHTIPGRGVRNYPNSAAYLDYEANQIREQQLHEREKQLQQQQKELQKKQIQQKQQVEQEKQQQEQIDRAIEYERRLREPPREPPPPPAPLAPAQVESQSGWSGSRISSERILSASVNLGIGDRAAARVLSPIHQLASTSQSIRSLLTPTHHHSQIIRNSTPQHLAPPPFGRSVSSSPHSRSTSDIPSIHGSHHPEDSSYIRKWLGEAAALVSAVKIPQSVQFPAGIGLPSNLSSTPPLTSHLSSTPPLTDSHLSSTPPLTDSQLSITPPFSVAQLPSGSPIANSFFASSHIGINHFSSSPIHARMPSTPPSAYFPSTPPPSATFLPPSSSLASYLSNSTPPVSASYVPSTPPPSAEYFPSTPPAASYLVLGSERGGVLSTDALRHSQLLQTRLAEVVAARRNSWLDENDILSTPAKALDPGLAAPEKNTPASNNYSAWKEKCSDNAESKPIDWKVSEVLDEKQAIEKVATEEYSSLKYTPETKIPDQVFAKPADDTMKFPVSPNIVEPEITKSFLNITTPKVTMDFIQKESDWSISNRVKSIFDDIKRNAISDFVKQKELDESAKDGKDMGPEDKLKTSPMAGDWWSSFTDKNKVSEDLASKRNWPFIDTQSAKEGIPSIDSMKTGNTMPHNPTILQDKLSAELEIKILDEEVAQTMKSNTDWLENTRNSMQIAENETLGENNSKNTLISSIIAESKDENSNRNVQTVPFNVAGEEQKEEENKNKAITVEETTFKRSGKEGRRGSDGGGRPSRGSSRGDTPPLSRESRGSFKRARRGSGEGGSPVGGGAMVEECIIRPRVEAEKPTDEEAAEVSASTELMREGSEFSKTLKGVQTGMDSLTRLTDNVFEENERNTEAAIAASELAASKPMNERPKVLGGENYDNVSVTDTSGSDSSQYQCSSSENRKSWSGMDISNRDAMSDSRDSKDSEKSSLSNSSSRSDMESESTKRVRAYLESLSARIKQQIPYSTSSESHNSSSTSASSRLVSMSSSETPPTSARLMSYSSSETPPSSACPMSLSSSETPPSSADAVAGTPGARPSLADTPTSPAFFAPTPPHSAGLNNLGNANLDGYVPVADGNGTLQRTTSWESLNSDTSVNLGELEEAVGQVTAQLSITLIYDSETGDLEVLVEEANELVMGPDSSQAPDTYVRVFLLPDKSTNMQTRVFQKSLKPAYKERFLFGLEEEESISRALAFYLYSSDKYSNTLVGEGELKLGDMALSTCPSTISIPLTDSGQQKGEGYGDILFSLSYLPTAERLTVVVVKARSLQWIDDKTSADPFVKVYIIQNGKKLMKKKTSVKRDSRSPVFNEAMIFNIPAPTLHNIQLRVTVAEHTSDGRGVSVGHVIVATQATGKALSHWNQMMTALRKPIGMWHPLLR